MTTLIAPQKARVLTDYERLADLRLAKDFLEDFLQDEAVPHDIFDLADEARIKVVVAMDKLRRWQKVTA